MNPPSHFRKIILQIFGTCQHLRVLVQFHSQIYPQCYIVFLDRKPLPPYPLQSTSYCLVNIKLALLLWVAGMTMPPVWTMPEMGDLSEQQRGAAEPKSELLFLLYLLFTIEKVTSPH